MSKRTLALGLLVLVLSALAFAGWWFLLRSGDETLPDPRALVPATTEIYAEIPSLAGTRETLREAGAITGFPVGLEMITRPLPRVIQDALANPAGFGLDESRPLGMAARLAGGRPVVVGFLPVDDLATLAEAFNVEASALQAGEPVGLEGAFVLFRRGYLIAAAQAEPVADLVALDSAPLVIPAPPAGSLLSTYLSPAAITAARDAGTQMGAALPGSARLGVAFFTSALESVNGVQASLVGSPRAYGLRLILDLKDGSGLGDAFKDAAGAPSLVDHLPPARIMAGARVNPEGMRRASAKMLTVLEPILEDTEVIAVMRASLDVISREMAVAFVNWEPSKPADVLSVTLQTIPSQGADEFIGRLAALRDHGVKSMSRLMRGAGLENISQSAETLPVLERSGVSLEGLAITTHLNLQPPPGADSQVLALFARMNTQRVVQRFGRVRSGEQDFYLTVTGDDTALIDEALRRARTPEAPGAAWKEALGDLGDKLVGWALIDVAAFKPVTPTAGDDAAPPTASPTGPPATIALRFQGRSLALDLSIPKEAIKQLVR